MKTNNNYARAAVLGCAFALLSSGAVAGTVTADHVTYTFNDADLGLFGSASQSGDSLVFAPGGFSTSSFAFQTIDITVTAAAGYSLGGFSLSENGGYTLSGGSAYATGSLTAIDIEGTTGNQIKVTFNGALKDAGAWDAAAAIALPATGWGGTDGVVTSVTLTLSNQLFATGGASISKTGVSITATALPVPEAHTSAMMLAGLGLVGFMAWRRGANLI